jgi:acetolactate synthase-1/2/3 large subunit
MLIEFLKSEKNKSQWADHAQELVKEWQNEFAPLCNSDASPIHVEKLCKDLTDFLPSNAILVSDTGYAAIWTGTLVYLNHLDQKYIRAAGSLGWALPASIGAKCAAPDRPVICFIGDGGLMYHLSELETASRHNIKTVTVVNNNHCLRQCLEGVNLAYGDRPGNRDEMCMFREVNFAKIAQEMGCFGIRVESPREISEALRKALKADQPAVVDVVTDIKCKPPSPWVPF